MLIRDTTTGYGILSRLMHWTMAFAIIAMFALGLWMVTLNYYSPWYRTAPDIHKSVGIILLIALIFRFGWRLANARVDDSDLSPFERKLAGIVHWGFYPLLLALMVSGYFISTADGRAIDVFGWFSVPSIVRQEGLEDTAGFIHKILAYATIIIAALHAIAALKHHFFDRSSVLRRMWSGPESR